MNLFFFKQVIQSLDKNSLFVTFTKHVAILPFYVPTNSLLASLGKLKDSKGITLYSSVSTLSKPIKINVYYTINLFFSSFLILHFVENRG